MLLWIHGHCAGTKKPRKGINVPLQDIKLELEKRDYIDSHRDFAPLRQAEDAILLDTSDMTIEEVVETVSYIVRTKVGL